MGTALHNTVTPTVSCQDLLETMRLFLKENGYTQVPQMSSEQFVNLERCFAAGEHLPPNAAGGPFPPDPIAGPEVSRIGLRFTALPPQEVFVEKVAPDTWAANQGWFSVGDKTIALNGKQTSNMSDADFQNAMTERPLKI